jgi:3-oxoacyl-[acyl-carrier-protein] synthase II
MKKRIAITGAGIVCALGVGKEACWEAALAGKPGMSELKLFPSGFSKARLVAQVRDDAIAAARRYVPNVRRMSRTDLMGIIAAGEALSEAGLFGSAALSEAGVCMGSSTGGIFESETYFENYKKRGFARTRVALTLSHPVSRPAAAVARAFGLAGPGSTLMNACASGAAAIGFAADLIACGMAPAMVAGGSDGLCRLTHTGFNSLRAVDPEPCRPFDRNRRGLNLGEGAGVLVLEDWECAKRRGARVLGEFLGYAETCDAHHMTAPHPEGVGAEACMRLAITRAGVTPDDVDYVNAHGTGTIHNDAMEAKALKRVFGDAVTRLCVASTKSMTGHTLGAAGGVEAVLTLWTIIRGRIPPAVGLAEPDESVSFDVVGKEAREKKVRVALSNSFGFGGSNAALVLAAADYRGAPS